MAKLRDDLDALTATVDELHHNQQYLLDELATQAGYIVTLCRVNGHLVKALNNAWATLDRLTGRQPDVRRAAHAHQWQTLRPCLYQDSHGNTYAEGVTERCECGAIRHRATAWSSPEALNG
jgi:hypothetical protein